MADHHDKLFKAVFDKPQNAAVYFEAFLPPVVVKALDLGRADLQSGSVIDGRLRALHTDLLYRVPFRDVSGDLETRPFLFILFEHQSTEDRLLPWRMLRYMVRIWSRWLHKREDVKRLPLILPIVLSQTGESWKASTEFADLLNMDGGLREAVLPIVPKMRLLLTELFGVPDDQIPGSGSVRFALLLMKHIRDPRILSMLATWLDDVSEILRREGVDVSGLELYVSYILEGNDQVDPAELAEILGRVSEEAQHMALSVAERLREEGREEGEEKGREEGRREANLATARRLLTKGVPVPEVSELVDMPEEEVRKLAE